MRKLLLVSMVLIGFCWNVLAVASGFTVSCDSRRCTSPNQMQPQFSLNTVGDLAAMKTDPITDIYPFVGAGLGRASSLPKESNAGAKGDWSNITPVHARADYVVFASGTNLALCAANNPECLHPNYIQTNERSAAGGYNNADDSVRHKNNELPGVSVAAVNVNGLQSKNVRALSAVTFRQEAKVRSTDRSCTTECSNDKASHPVAFILFGVVLFIAAGVGRKIKSAAGL